MRGWIRMTTLVAAAVVALTAVPAAAATGSVNDPNDVEGKLDLAKLSFVRPGPNGPLTITVRTHEPWGLRVLRDNVNRLTVQLDVQRDGVKDYVARFRKSDNRLIVTITGSGSAFEPLRVTRPDRRTVRFTIPGGSPPNPSGPRPGLRAYSRFIEALACDPASGSHACVDRAPNKRWL